MSNWGNFIDRPTKSQARLPEQIATRRPQKTRRRVSGGGPGSIPAAVSGGLGGRIKTARSGFKRRVAELDTTERPAERFHSTTNVSPASSLTACDKAYASAVRKSPFGRTPMSSALPSCSMSTYRGAR